MSPPPKFSVLIVGYNCPQEIRRLLESLRGLPSWGNCEILIAENGSQQSEAMETLGREYSCKVEFLPNPGFGIACNHLARLARGTILVLANPDLRFSSDIFAGFENWLENRDVGAVGPLLRDEDGSEQISWNQPMGLWWEFLEAHGLQTWWRRRLMREIRRCDPQGPWKVGFATAACLALRAETFAEIGGFDEGFFLNGEDIELCDRIRSSGRSVLVDPRLEAFHGNSAVQGRDLSRFVADRLEGKRKYLSRRYRGIRLFIARGLWVEMVLIRLLAGILLLRGVGRTRIPGYRRILLESLALLLPRSRGKRPRAA